MKREEREFAEDQAKQNEKKHFKDKPKQKKYSVDAAQDQMKAYAMRQKSFYSYIGECQNNYDPIFPDRKLKMNDALYFLHDKNQRRWCFNLVTLWPKFEATNSYDIEKLYRDYGNIILTILDTKETEFQINIQVFVRLKKTYYKYAHNIDWNPQFIFN
jgi:hypothetical protein